ncbi:hypothetical protein JCM10296v2_007476 [Rhodotorula toruloides]
MAAPAPAAPPTPATPAAPVPPAAATPFEPKLLQQEIDHSFLSTLTCDLELDVTVPKIKITTIPLKGVALAGVWTCKVSKAEDDGKLAFEVTHGVLPIGVFGQRVTVHMSVSAVVGEREYALNRSIWAKGPSPSASSKTAHAATPLSYSGYLINVKQDDIDRIKWSSGRAYEPAEHRQYRLAIEIEQIPDAPTDEARQLMKRMCDLGLSPTPYDVRLFFPDAGDGGAELWSHSDFLDSSAYYFGTLLYSGFAETVTHSKKRPRTRANASTKTPPLIADDDQKTELDDSNDETDRVFFEECPTRLHEHEGDCPLEYRQITITKTAFTTYRAVLSYLRTGYIVFAPLSSACKPLSTTSKRTRKQQLLDIWYRQPSFPVSPKSAFRLAHLIGFGNLQELCLVNLRKQLTVEIAPVELVDNASVCFDEWRKVIIDYIFENWDKVEESDGWKKIQGRIRRDEVPGAAPVMLELMGRFAAKKDKA